MEPSHMENPQGILWTQLALEMMITMLGHDTVQGEKLERKQINNHSKRWTFPINQIFFFVTWSWVVSIKILSKW